MTEQEFLLPIIQRNTNSDGMPKDERLLQRMDNPTCRECHNRFRKKYPNQSFDIECQGIYQEEDFLMLSEKTGLPYDMTREVLDRVYWAEQHIKVTDEKGDMIPFKARDYQCPVLACTARRKVDRMGRGLGKTTLGIIEELHTAMNRKNYSILVLCPAKSQAQKWFDDLIWQIENDESMRDSLTSKRQQPFFMLQFRNGTTISIFTAGSQSGRDADVIRSQSPRRVRLEEQDLLSDGDYKAVMPLLRRYKDSEFHGASTPTGARSIYWEMCQRFTDYQEFYAPISVHPDWSKDMEMRCRREARTETVYQHEFLAEFGELEQGVFKAGFIDAALSHYSYIDCQFDKNKKYYMGVDWNGKGTGTRIRIIEYDTDTHKRKMVAAHAVDWPGATTQDSIEAIRDYNRVWHCDSVYIDKGYGHVQDEMLRMVGKMADNLDDKRLLHINVIDFGAKLKTNSLIPNRGDTRYRQKEEIERPTKPFMVEGTVMCMEKVLFEFSDQDTILDNQMRAYRVKTWSSHGFPGSFTSGKEGDHDLDATMLALLGIELECGLFQQNQNLRPLASISYVPGFGESETRLSVQQSMDRREHEAKALDVPSRQTRFTEEEQKIRLLHLSRNSAIVAPYGKGPTSRKESVPSRTKIFRDPGRRGPNR